MPLTEADTCRKFVVPKLQEAGWDDAPHDAPTCKNIVLARVVGSMPEFKQIIGRGTRLRPDYGKLAFNIIDYTGTATEKFADPAFDGEPVGGQEAVLDAEGEVLEEHEVAEPDFPQEDLPEDFASPPEAHEGPYIEPRKFYVDGGQVEILQHQIRRARQCAVHAARHSRSAAVQRLGQRA